MFIFTGDNCNAVKNRRGKRIPCKLKSDRKFSINMGLTAVCNLMHKKMRLPLCSPRDNLLEWTLYYFIAPKQYNLRLKQLK